MELIFFELHDVQMSFPHVEQFRNIFLPHNVATPKGGTFMLAGHDLGDIVGQWHPDGLFYRNGFQHYCNLLETL
jgi:hypothetical protein